MKEFSKRLKALRLEHGLMPIELADKLGVHNSTLNRWESGKMSITDDNIIRVAKFFDVSAGYLLGLEDNRTLPKSATTTTTVFKAFATTIRKNRVAT